jgi:hypothetical protein
MTPKPPTKKTQSKEAPLNADRAGVFSVSFRVASLFQKAAGGGHRWWRETISARLQSSVRLWQLLHSDVAGC